MSEFVGDDWLVTNRCQWNQNFGNSFIDIIPAEEATPGGNDVKLAFRTCTSDCGTLHFLLLRYTCFGVSADTNAYLCSVEELLA